MSDASHTCEAKVNCTITYNVPQAPSRAKVIDAAGKYVMPGGIDPHTHLDMPFMGQVACDDFYR
jgi:imidazolonepropionase-like amidohydrolase